MSSARLAVILFRGKWGIDITHLQITASTSVLLDDIHDSTVTNYFTRQPSKGCRAYHRNTFCHRIRKVAQVS